VRFDEYRFSGLPDKKPNPNLFSLSPRNYTKGLLSIGPKGFNDNRRPRTDSFLLRAYHEKKEFITIEPSAQRNSDTPNARGVVKDKTRTMADELQPEISRAAVYLHTKIQIQRLGLNA
jgi:hypothetical protein